MLQNIKNLLLLHGPNLNLLGQRETAIYGNKNLKEIDQAVIEQGKKYGIKVYTRQSNQEGILIEYLQKAKGHMQGILFNPGAYTHTSIALRDTILSISIPVIEIHISNLYAREDFRHKSFIAPVCLGQISGFGWHSYLLGLDAFYYYWKEKAS